jgi:hypothetical protein
MSRNKWGRYRYWVTTWQRCSHRSHTLRLWCWRGWSYQSYCPKHNRTCHTWCNP